MAEKKRASPGDSGKKMKQKILSFSAQPARQAPTVEVEDVDAPVLGAAHLQELEHANDAYLQHWCDKCQQVSDLRVGGAAREEVDLDTRGMKAVAAFRHAAELADALGSVVPHKALEILMLIVRNDCNHRHSHVSQAAFATLSTHLSAHPYARLERHAQGSGPYAGQCYVAVRSRSAWLPMESDRTSFSSCYLLVPDTAISARNWKLDTEGAPPHKRERDGKWAHPCDMVKHCLDAALHSAERDDNGSLLALRYLTLVMEQDLAARLQAHSEWGSPRWAGDEAVAGRRKALLQNSLTWRILDCSHDSAARAALVEALVRLIAGRFEGEDADLASAASEEHDDSQAGACALTRRELAALGSRLLTAMLRLYGAAEAAGHFLAVSNHRASATNLRMALDCLMLKAFWSNDGVCHTPEASRALLRALPPRDALRMLGLVVAQKFAATFDHAAPSYLTLVADIRGVLGEAAGMLDRGGDAASFYEVDTCAAVASLHKEPLRSVTTYRSADHLAALVGGFAAAAAALAAAGEAVPCGAGGVKELQQELAAAIAAVAGVARERRSEACRLSRAGAAELLAAHLAVEGLA